MTAEEAPAVTEKMLAAYMQHRLSLEESFQAFTGRYSTEELKQLFDQPSAASH